MKQKNTFTMEDIFFKIKANLREIQSKYIKCLKNSKENLVK